MTHPKSYWISIILFTVVIKVLIIVAWFWWCTNLEIQNNAFLTDVLNIKKEKKELKADTSNWQTYRNEEHGFELSVPNYYNLVKYEIDDYIILVKHRFVAANHGYIHIGVKDTPFAWENIKDYRGNRIYPEKVEVIKIAGNNAYQYHTRYRDSEWTNIEIPNEEKIITITFEEQKTVNSVIISEIKEKILNSFKFIE